MMGAVISNTPMSFDVFLQRFVAGKPAEVMREAVQAVLDSTDFTGPSELGFYLVRFPDGVSVEFLAGGLSGTQKFTGCAFFIRGMSPHLIRFIFEVAKAGDMGIIPMMEDSVMIFPSMEQLHQLPLNYPPKGCRRVVCASPEELECLMTGGYSGWQKYRNYVMNEKQDSLLP